MGPGRLVLRTDGVHPHRSTNGNSRTRNHQIHTPQLLGRRLTRSRGIPICRPGGGVEGTAVFGLDECGADVELLRFVLGSEVVRAWTER